MYSERRNLRIDRASFVENRRETLLIALGMTLTALLEAPGGTMGIGNVATSGRSGDWGAKTVAVVGRRRATVGTCSGLGEAVVACTTMGVGNCLLRSNQKALCQVVTADRLA